MTLTEAITASRFACPVCKRPNSTLAAKKAHVKLKHGPKPKRES